MEINSTQPLADRMRPKNFSEFFGQKEIVGKGKLLRKLIENDELSSLVFWGLSTLFQKDKNRIRNYDAYCVRKQPDEVRVLELADLDLF